jgi:hypothetical protein
LTGALAAGADGAIAAASCFVTTTGGGARGRGW